jgi:hypothetical protein
MLSGAELFGQEIHTLLQAADAVITAGMVMPGYVSVAAGFSGAYWVPIDATRSGEAFAAWNEWNISWTSSITWCRYNSADG